MAFALHLGGARGVPCDHIGSRPSGGHARIEGRQAISCRNRGDNTNKQQGKRQSRGTNAPLALRDRGDSGTTSHADWWCHGLLLGPDRAPSFDRIVLTIDSTSVVHPPLAYVTRAVPREASSTLARRSHRETATGSRDGSMRVSTGRKMRGKCRNRSEWTVAVMRWERAAPKNSWRRDTNSVPRCSS